ncbi:MAG TPA: alpha/beta hydrolase [Terracidiphilus sp.]
MQKADTSPVRPLEDQYATVNGVRLHYVESGSGRLILFLHGFPEFWYGWKNQLTEFGRSYHAVAPDMRGYNLSAKPAAIDDYKAHLLVEDVRALAEVLSPREKLIMVAHDWGGAIAWSFAAAYPDRLERLVIINAPHPAVFARLLVSDPEQQKASSYMLLFRSDNAEKTLSENNYALLVNAVLGEGLKTGAFTEQDKAAYLQAWSQPGALTGGLNYYRAARVGPPALGGTRAAGSLASSDVARLIVRVPTLVMWGEKDTALTIRNLDGLDRFVPNLTVKLFPDGSHWVVHEKPEEVNAAIREFIESK